MSIVDVQSRTDHRKIAIHRVGIKGIKHPIYVTQRDQTSQPSVAIFDMAVSLPDDVKGTHMSRFVDVLQQLDTPIDTQSFAALLQIMRTRLDAQMSFIQADFPFFMQKKAPASGVVSLMDYQVSFIGHARGNDNEILVKLVVPVTSLCPCSKEISKYGAHNQRSHVTLTVRANAAFPFVLEEWIELVETQASCQLYGLLKRSDEKFVTEQAYENPKFVEDMVRDIAEKLKEKSNISGFCVESENFESIHNHSAYAIIDEL